MIGAELAVEAGRGAPIPVRVPVPPVDRRRVDEEAADIVAGLRHHRPVRADVRSDRVKRSTRPPLAAATQLGGEKASVSPARKP
jgi:hypothetical protein